MTVGIRPPTPKRIIDAKKRQARAFEMFADGKDTKFIAGAFNVNPKTVRRWLLEFRRSVSELAAEEIKTRHLAMLDLALDKWEPGMLQGEIEALDQALKIMDRQAKYLGLYAPTKIDGTVQYSGTVQHLSRDELRGEVLKRLKEMEQQKNRLAAIDAVPSEN